MAGIAGWIAPARRALDEDALGAEACTLVYCGSLTPMAGWVSRSFDCREPAPSIVWAARLTGPAVLRTEIVVRN